MLFVNADDIGWNKETTDRILTCYIRKSIHSASAMTFMADSERAADLVKENQLPVGLHLNLDEKITGSQVPVKLREHHRVTSDYLNAKKWNQIIYNPFLHNSFEYVFRSQWDEFYRIYGQEPKRLDGHHHMHLCMNMLVSGKYPKGLKVRRNFSFRPGEKGPFNRFYRYMIDLWLTSRFQCTDHFFSIAPINDGKLRRLVSMSSSSDVELMVHPGVENECSFLLSPKWESLMSDENLKPVSS